MLPYFNAKSPKDWNAQEIVHSVKSIYPEENNSYHVFIAKKELAELSFNSKKQSYREKAQEILNNWVLTSAKTTASEKAKSSSNNCTNFIHYGSNNANNQYLSPAINFAPAAELLSSSSSSCTHASSSKNLSKRPATSSSIKKDSQYLKEFDMAMALDLNTIMKYYDGNNYMQEFIKKYNSMNKDHMHQLSDGSYLEERLFRFGLTCTHEHLCHSFIFDPSDLTYTQENVLTEDQVSELKLVNPVVFPDLDDETVDYLMKFSEVTTVHELRVALHQNSGYNLNYDKEKDQIKDWIYRSLYHLLLIYESNEDFNIEHSEQWYQTRVWLPLELVFECIAGGKSLRGESSSNASSERKNLARTVPSNEKLKTKKMGTRVDMLVTVNNVEHLCEEDKPSDDDTKVLEERHFKIGKEMKDILWVLFKNCNYNRIKMKKLVSLGVTTFKFKAFFDVCDFQLGYVSRITRSSEFRIPPTMSEFSNLLPTLSMMLVFRLMILNNLSVLEESNPMVEIRNSLKRPHANINDDDDFICGVKRAVCATTPRRCQFRKIQINFQDLSF